MAFDEGAQTFDARRAVVEAEEAEVAVELIHVAHRYSIGTCRTYSWRSATTGSTRDARRAGTQAATSANKVRMATAAESAHASPAFTPKRNDSIQRVNASDAGMPMAMPSTAEARTLRSTIHSTVARGAPRAMRMPISLVRRATEYDVAP